MTNYPDIEVLLPHDKPMILIDKAVDIQSDTVHCQVTIGEHNPFFEQQTQTVPAYVGIEFMAQAIAAWSGFHAMQQQKQPPIGFLLGSRRFTTQCDSYQGGITLDIYAQKVMEDNGMAVFSAQIEHDGTQIASCQLNVYVPSPQKLEQMNIRSPQ
ncbi:hotdog family protein [Vibrio gallicus]|uniref:hotdog family protein n=1 Tax=Vibrio gallicus TaxID=190897 RepID=UPI0021C483FF|nr:hotdog family protein [Vibrio gallicus]